MVKEKKDMTPAELASLVRQKMVDSAPDVDLNLYIDLDQLEEALVQTLREIRLKPIIHPQSKTKH